MIVFTTPRRAFACTALLCFLAGASIAGYGADAARRVPVTLSAQDRDQLGKLACASYQVDAESVGPAFRWSGDAAMSRVVYAPVRCAPHTQTQPPAHYNVSCLRRDGRWQCQQGREALSVTTRFGDVSVEPGSFSYTQAVQAVQAAAASNRFRAEIEAALPTGCGLYVDVSAHTDELADLSCNNGHSFLISFWCPQQDCPRLLSMR